MLGYPNTSITNNAYKGNIRRFGTQIRDCKAHGVDAAISENGGKHNCRRPLQNQGLSVYSFCIVFQTSTAVPLTDSLALARIGIRTRHSHNCIQATNSHNIYYILKFMKRVTYQSLNMPMNHSSRPRNSFF